MELPNIKEIAPSESGYPDKKNQIDNGDDKEFKELFNKKDSYFQYLFKKGMVSMWTENRIYFCRDGAVYFLLSVFTVDTSNTD